MKNLLTVVMLFVFSTALYAQKDVTKFLGIPVDGTKTAMIQKLKAKGFTPSTCMGRNSKRFFESWWK
ncbi:hypothetical protein [Barnesiella intestinihominis]|uniref:hypothetical protein n=1 Tax=Barnesiella intestinihominis TaxID=487174 RepID=UPI003A8F00A5